MSGAVAAHAAYNGSGTQGLAVTNTVSKDDADLMSVFWNKNDTTRQLLYGSSIVDIPSSGASQLSLGGTRLFTVNNDIDCLGDMYLELSATLPQYQLSSATAGTPSVSSLLPKPFSLQTLVTRIEIQVGTQIWQTIENTDLRVVNSSELSLDAFTETSVLSTPTATLTSAQTANTAWIVIPSLTKTLGPRLCKFSNQTEDGYPMAAAPHQSVKIKVYFRDPFPDSLTSVADVTTGTTEATKLFFEEDVPFNCTLTYDVQQPSPATLTAGALIFTKNTDGHINACKLYAKQQIMCNEERDQMKAMPMGMPKRLKMTQNAYITDIGSSATKTVELDHFSLFASHLIISGFVGLDSSQKQIRLSSVELKLNSSSFSGQLPGVLLDSCTSDSLGLFSNKFIYGDGVAGDDTESTIEVEEFGLGTYVFPLASTAFSGSCVPLNRFDSIRLTLVFTSAPAAVSSSFINVTCVGETTALFKDGAASLAMY